MNKGAQVVEDIKKTTGNNNVEVMEMDLTSLQSVRILFHNFKDVNYQLIFLFVSNLFYCFFN